MQDADFSLRPVAPYDFELTSGYMTFFRGAYAADSFEDGVFRRLLDLGDGFTLASVTSAGTTEEPRLDVQLRSHDLGDSEVAEARRQVAWMLGLDDDLDPFYRMARADRHLAPFVERFWGLHPPHTPSVYESLVQAILGQQISSHVARMLRGLLTETYGQKVRVDGQVYRAFPRPEALAAAGLDGMRAVKLSARKAEYITDIASRVARGELDLEGLRQQPVEDAIEVLTAIRGVGLWTAHWLAIHALGSPDGFPHGDLALQRHVGKLVNGGTPMDADQVLDYSRRWAPYRGYVTVYLFAAGRTGQLDELTASIT